MVGLGGAELMVSVVLVCVVRLSVSVAVRGMLCVPTERLVVLNCVPLPMFPLIEEFQFREFPVSVLVSGSVAVPLKVMRLPLVCCALFAGRMMDAVGGCGSRMVM